MPCDLNGVPVKVGDEVLLRCIVVGLGPGEKYCHASLETVLPMFEGDAKRVITAISTRQLERVAAAA